MAALGAAQGKRPLREGGRAGGQYLTGPNLWTMENWRTDLLEVRTKGRVGGGRPSCASSFLLSIHAASPSIHLPSKLPHSAQAAPDLAGGPTTAGTNRGLGDPLQRAGKQGYFGERSQMGLSLFFDRPQGRKSFREDRRGRLMGVGRFRARTTQFGDMRDPAD